MAMSSGRISDSLGLRPTLPQIPCDGKQVITGACSLAKRSGRRYGKTTEAERLSMTSHVGSTKHISLQVRDQQGTAYTVRLAVAEQQETGTLAILTPTGAV